MRPRVWLTVVGVGGALLTAMVLTACGLVGAPPALPVPPEATVDIGEDMAAARVNDGLVEVLVSTGAEHDVPGEVSVITSSPATGANSVYLLSYGGATDEPFNTFIYGTADPGMSRVNVDLPGGVGGQVVNGAWLIALPQKDVTPDQFNWQFLDGHGATIASGNGITASP